ncbi:hypothetical protein [Clostridium omnivorum]|uniref:DUF5640 domain-containing protein n=1 Tax=Clostridium omnivorum TaxID=1604902 RepID=A0ABQ5N8Y4_9CLOT|nr:hypothetical protein [Clostridium sp. E14]GLC31728.1 hypothetical protein bsdE14_31380 [Clostridium sp. E14]
MSNRKVKVFIFASIVIIAFALITMNFDLRLDRFGTSKITWTDCIQINNTKYYRGNKKTIVEPSEIGNKIGEVTYNVAGKVGNPKYRFRDGDATLVSVGTEIYDINKIDNAIAVKIGEQYYLYSIEK